MVLCWRTCWVSWCQMAMRCFEAMKSYPQRDSVHRSLTEGSGRSGRKQRNTNESGREECAARLKATQPPQMTSQPGKEDVEGNVRPRMKWSGARCGEEGHSWLMYVRHPHPCLVKLISFLHKWLPENGSLNQHLGGETQTSRLFWGLDRIPDQ